MTARLLNVEIASSFSMLRNLYSANMDKNDKYYSFFSGQCFFWTIILLDISIIDVRSLNVFVISFIDNRQCRQYTLLFYVSCIIYPYLISNKRNIILNKVCRT